MTKSIAWQLLPRVTAAALSLACLTGPHLMAQDVVEFSYEQTDSTTGSGFFFGNVDGVIFSGEMPAAEVSQNDLSDLPIPADAVGYMDEANNSNPGNDFGVHLDWPDTITIRGERVVDAFTLELYELEVDTTIPDGGLPAANWSWEAVLTDDFDGNDAFGDAENFRIANFVGEPLSGHRHSAGQFGLLVEGEADNVTISGSFGNVGSNGQGDPLGMSISLRNGVFEDGSGPLYVDNIKFTGGVAVDLSNLDVVGTSKAADFNGDDKVDFTDFLILGANFNTDGTNRVDGGDMTADDRTDLRDFILFREAYVADAGAGEAASVPEPTSGWMALVASMAICFARRKRPATSRKRFS